MRLNRAGAFAPFAFCALGAFFAFGASPAPKGMMTVSDPDVAILRLIKAEEKKSTLSYRNNSGVVANANKHVLALSFRILGDNVVSTTGALGSMPGATSSTNGTNTMPTTGTVGGPIEPERMLLEPIPVTTGSTTMPTTGATTATTGSTGSGPHSNPQGVDTQYFIWIANPGEMAAIGSRLPVLPSSGHITAGVPAGVGIEVMPNEEAVIHLASTAALAAGSITVTIETRTTAQYGDNPATPGVNEAHTDSSSGFQKVTYDISKYLCDDASIDTRKAYGLANREGELAEDANADPAELNFGNWIWKGGLFVGNMPWQTRDQSGLARAQLYPQTSSRTTACRLATLTMFYRGAPANATGNVTFGAYVPGSTDPNLLTGAGTVTWVSRWDIQPRTTPGSPRDASKDPLYRLAFTSSSSTGEYANWQLSSVTNTTSETPLNVFKGVGIAIENETDFVNGPYTGWRYFASQEFQADFSTFPESDSAPRLWVVDYVSQTNFSHIWVIGH